MLQLALLPAAAALIPGAAEAAGKGARPDGGGCPLRCQAPPAGARARRRV
jgi:hypothetical protein